MKLSLNGQRFEYAIQIKSRDIIYKDGSPCILTVRPTDNQLFVSCVERDVLLQYEIVLKPLNLKGMAQNENTRYV